ncbi:hypothetical protein AB1K84_23570 [Mesobacillus foraminis]|uniref:hypothetical protein n=1 Tax=Mesobacillus foraminis TaxID=279826 RepID=UPI00399F38E9
MPFNATATVVLPKAEIGSVTVNGGYLKELYKDVAVQNGDVIFEVESGTYEFIYTQEIAKGKNLHAETDIKILLADEEAKELILEYLPELNYMPDFLLNGSLESIMLNPFSKSNLAEFKELDAKLRVLGKSQHLEMEL